MIGQQIAQVIEAKIQPLLKAHQGQEWLGGLGNAISIDRRPKNVAKDGA
jgi:hypothetical protein